jgi:hypothetical protein
MLYTLFSRGRVLGTTELDLPAVQSHVRMGFVEPSADGLRSLPDAVGVADAVTALSRAAKHAPNGVEYSLTEYADFAAVVDRREALKLELRDATGELFPAEWIQIMDLTVDPFAIEEHYEDDETEEDEGFDAETELESEFADEYDGPFDLPDDWLTEVDEFDATPRGWLPPDPRWESMKYHIMVYMARGERLRETTT